MSTFLIEVGARDGGQPASDLSAELLDVVKVDVWN